MDAASSQVGGCPWLAAPSVWPRTRALPSLTARRLSRRLAEAKLY